MQFLRTIFWVILAVLGAIFSFNNWEVVTVHLWNGLLLDTKLPVLLLVVFLAGLLPPLALYRTTRWRLRRRLDAAQRAMLPVDPVPPAPPAQAPAAGPDPLIMPPV